MMEKFNHSLLSHNSKYLQLAEIYFFEVEKQIVSSQKILTLLCTISRPANQKKAPSPTIGSSTATSCSLHCKNCNKLTEI